MDLLFAFPENQTLSQSIAYQLQIDAGAAEFRHFPDGESYIQICSDVKDRDIGIVCSLNQPDQKALALMFFAQTAKEIGAKRVGLIAPYLAYMRQDKRFHVGEAMTSKGFANLISQHFDWLLTIDPHLHRYKSLAEVYTIPSTVSHAIEPIAGWIKSNVQNPFLLGPDEESRQWVAEIAGSIHAPFQILQKVRHGDRQVEVSVPDSKALLNHTPVLVDDIIATAQTMIEAAKHLQELKLTKPLCICVHPIFAGNSYQDLGNTVSRIVSCTTIVHASNGIDVSELIANAIHC